MGATGGGARAKGVTKVCRDHGWLYTPTHQRLQAVEGSHPSYLEQRHGVCDGSQVGRGGCTTGTAKEDGGEWTETRAPFL
jgi:hypothetical protein